MELLNDDALSEIIKYLSRDEIRNVRLISLRFRSVSPRLTYRSLIETAKKGSQEALLFFINPLIERMRAICVFRCCCERGFLSAAKQIEEIYRLTPREARIDYSYVLRAACVGGHRKVAEWLIDKYNFTDRDIKRGNGELITQICEAGYADIAKWIIESFGLEKRYVVVRRNEVYEMLYRKGDIDMIIWLLDNFGVSSKCELCSEIKYYLKQNMAEYAWALGSRGRFTRSY